MPPVPLLPARDVIKVFESFGWRIGRKRGSHRMMTRPGSEMTLSVPMHREVKRGTLRSLIADAGLTIEEFTNRLQEL
jgi:predicted RNA binding protein YcfA (HicA-like mRNA interferase family)